MLADDVHDILNGAKPGDIPIYQPTQFEFLINLKAAKAIDLTIPPMLLVAAEKRSSVTSERHPGLVLLPPEI